MRSRSRIATATVAVVLVGTTAWIAHERRSRSTTSSTATTTSALEEQWRGRALRRMRSSMAFAPVPSHLLVPGAADRRVAGTVLADGVPVAGARVALRSEYSRVTGENLATVTGADGGFDFGPVTVTAYALAVTTERHQPAIEPVDLRNPRPPVAPDRLLVELAPCTGWVSGRVSDASGAVINNGTVSLVGRTGGPGWFEPLVTVPLAADGSFAMCRLDQQQKLEVRAPGYGSAGLYGAMPIDGWNVILHPESIVAGRVIDQHGQPVAGARAVLIRETAGAIGPPMAMTAPSGPDGHFRIEGVPPGDYELAADHGRHRVAPMPWPSLAIEAGQQHSQVEITVHTCRSLSGVIVSDGEPVVGAHIEVTRGGWTYSQSDGSFVIGCMDESEQTLGVRGYDLDDATIQAGRADVGPRIVHARPQASIRGRVIAEGRPAARVRVTIGDPRRAFFVGQSRLTRYATVTDRKGLFVLGGVPPGRHEVQAWHRISDRQGGPVMVEVVGQTDPAPITVELEPAVAVSGHIEDRDGDPIVGLSIELVPANQPAPDTQDALMRASIFHASHSAITDEYGQFRLVGVPAGRYRICPGGCAFGLTDPPHAPAEGGAWPIIAVPDQAPGPTLHLQTASRAQEK